MQSGQIILYFVRFFKYLVFEVQKQIAKIQMKLLQH